MSVQTNKDVILHEGDAVKNVNLGDNPAANKSDTDHNTQKSYYHNILGQSGPEKEPPYGDTPSTSVDKSQNNIDAARQKFAPKAKDPTNAAGDPTKKLPDVIKQVDPQAAMQILQNMMSMLSMVNQTSQATSTVNIKTTVTNALTGALSILAEKYGFKTIIDIFTACLSNNGIQRIKPDYQNVVIEALSTLIKNAATYGENNLPYSTVPVVIYHSVGGPVPLPIYGFAPDLYVQQYYTPANDPYPGFIQWKGPNGDYIYTVRTATQPPYYTVDHAIRTQTEQQMATDLEPYIIKGVLTTDDLNNVLDKNFQHAENVGMQNSLGNNSSNIMNLLSQLLGILGQVINKTKNGHLPQSVLNTGSVNNSLESFSKNMAIIKKMKTDSKDAFKLPSALSGLLGGNLGNITGSLGSLGSSSSTISSVKNLSNIISGGN